MSGDMKKPGALRGKEYSFDAFGNGEVLLNKRQGRLPAMGWNSWNAFGSGNTESLTKEMADAIVALGLDQLGYQYVVLDDGCYKPERVNGELSNEEVKFPSGFRALADYIHGKGLKFGMYNDIGTNLCAGAAVGTCGHEFVDAKSYVDWTVDFLKVDNCYYLWDNATFSDAENAKYVYAPHIRAVRVVGEQYDETFDAARDGILRGEGAERVKNYVTNIGTFDGTGPEATPIGVRSSELAFLLDIPKTGEYELYVTYATGKRVGVGSWLQVAVGEGEASRLFYDDFVPMTENEETFAETSAIKIVLKAGLNLLRLMNHRRQENTLNSYATLLEGLNAADPEHDIVLSICEWGKTQPHNWGPKVGDSWRILNDITFCVGSDGDPGIGNWTSDYTTSVTAQYNKAVIMDRFAGLDKGWNDPDMLMVGMNQMTETMSKTHMTMWCMMNAPLMLGLDLRRVKKHDALWNIIANGRMIALNQDPLGVPARRVWCSLAAKDPDLTYVRDIHRADILAKPLADGSVAVSFINVSDRDTTGTLSINVGTIVDFLRHRMANKDAFVHAGTYEVEDLWTGERSTNTTGVFEVSELAPCDSVTIRIRAV